MRDPLQVERTRQTLGELFALWDSRADSYGRVLYGSALVKERDGRWKNSLTYVLPLHRTEVRGPESVADYGSVLIGRGLLALEEAKGVLLKIAEEEKLCLPKLPEVHLIADLYPGSWRYFHTSGDRGFPVSYPFLEFRFDVPQDFREGPPQRTLWAVDLPLYPSGRAAIDGLLGTHLGDDNAYRGELVALAPDYRARIRGLRLSTKAVEVNVECPPGSKEGDLIGKAYCEGNDGNVSAVDLAFDKGKASFETSDFPRHVVVALLSKSHKDRIDEKIFYAGSPYATSGVIVETPAEDIEHLVLGGESENLEFKGQLPSNRENIAVSAVALANRRGGRILIGVDDEGEIIGCQIEKGEDTITRILRSYCEPPVKFAVREITVREKRVVVIIIPEGEDKPYCVKDKGVYVRSGATNRVATRYELDEMYGAESGGGIALLRARGASPF